MNACDECGQVRCICGGQQRTQDKPRRGATPAEQLNSVLARWEGPWPVQLPHDRHSAAIRWIALQEPRKRSERITLVAVVSGEGKQREVDPYVARLKATLQAFLLADDALRDLVVEAVADKIYWRGESMELFANLYAETLEMRKTGVAAYRSAAIQAAKKLKSSMVVPQLKERVTGYNDEAEHDG